MENHTVNVRDLDPGDRAVFERVIGRPLHENEQMMIQLVGADASTSPDGATAHMPEWSDVYNGLSDEEVAEFRQESGPESS
ncbi:MAG TPA: hypothetical protein VHV55_05910 [Pirellulales bacterium]|jgi:hypothetical protein|nr:hypothetical protein [Pirellulales bacterium]